MADVVEKFGVGDNRGDLKSNSGKSAYFSGGIRPLFGALDNYDPDGLTAIEQRYREKTRITLLLSNGELAIARMT